MWVYNSQNATPDVQRVNQLARAAQIPITTITETLSPASATFEQWQVAELRNLQQALHQATGQMSPAADARRGSRSPGTGRVGAARSSVPVVRLQGAQARIGGQHGLERRRASTIAAGEFAAILGPNGSGKTTLLRVLLGELPLAAGTASVLGSRAGRGQAVRSATCPSAATSTRASGSAASTWSGSGWTAPAGDCRCAARGASGSQEVIELVGAGEYASRPIGRLSGGEQQRLLIAQALDQPPEAADPRRAAGQPRPAQPDRGGGAAGADLPRSSA